MATQSELKKVLVTGGLGYIGSHVVIALLLTGRYLPIVIDNCHNAYPEAVRQCAEIARDELGPSAPQPLFHQCDLRDESALEAVFSEYKSQGGIWAVVHLAALKAVGESGEIPLDYYKVNVGGSMNLLEVMSRYDCKSLVFSSSATVYGTPETIPIPETSPLQPESAYGRTKAMVEQIIEDTCFADVRKLGEGSLRAVSVRYFNPAGAYPSGKLGEEPKGRPGNLLPLLAQMAVGREKSDLKVFGSDYPTPDGTCVRDYLHVMDLAKGHVLSLDAMAKREGSIFSSIDTTKSGYYRAFNLGKGKGMSVLNMIDAMKKASGYDFQYEIVGRRQGDVPDLTADPAMAEKELGFVATEDLDTMCRDLWNFQTRFPKGW